MVRYDCPPPALLAERHSVDNITYYKCDVSSWEDVERVAARIRDEVGLSAANMLHFMTENTLDWRPNDINQQRGRGPR